MKRLVFSILLVLGVLLAAEGTLRLMASRSRSIDALLSPEPVRAAVRDKQLGWRGNPAYPEHDRLGYRNLDVPADASMVALGDSQTYGSQVRPDEAWPQQLERLGVKPAYNMGFPGWGPAQFLLALDEALALKPELIVAAVYTGNDLVDAFTFVYDSNQLRELRTPDPRLRAALERAQDTNPFDGDLLAHQDTDGFARRASSERSPKSVADVLAVNSRLYGLGVALHRAYDRAARRDSDDADLDEGDIPLETDRFRTVLTPNYRDQAVDLEDPRVGEGLRITLQVLEAMDRRCTAAGVRFGVVLIPTKELALADVAREHLEPASVEYADLVDDEDALRNRLRERLAAARISVVDPLPALRALARDGTLPYSATRDGHLSPSGQRAVAEALRATLSVAAARATPE